VYDQNLQVYGADKVWRQLSREGTAVGHWSLREGGVYEDRQVGLAGGLSSPDRYRVQLAAQGCFRFTLLRDDAAQPAQRAYEFVECPVPLPAPRITAPRRCSAKMPAMGEPESHSLLVRLEPSPGEGVQAYVDEELINDQVEVSDHVVYPDALRRHLPALNLGEAVLRSAVEAAVDGQLPGGLRLPFDARRVSYVRVFELEPGSSASKFGGVILFDAFDADGRLLGTVLQALLPMACVADER
jgi:hypothetical protein